MTSSATRRAGGSAPAAVSISVRNLQRQIRLDVSALKQFARRAAPIVAELKTKNRSALNFPNEILVVLVSDERIADLHQRFMDESGPTDVITFQHGEIFISAPTAQRQACEYGTSTLREIQLYIVHGLLHLRGFDDRTAIQRAKMRAAERAVLLRATV
jgi:probable rRNA maturation factor